MKDNMIRNSLLKFFKEKIQSRGNVKIVDLVEISDGWENEVYSFAIKPEHEELILRIYPGDGAARKATKEFNGMKRLHELGFPVPEVFILELDESYFNKPFVIMEKINGRDMGEVLSEASEEKKQELVTLFCGMFAKLHAMDWKEFGVIQPDYEVGDPYGFSAYMVSFAHGYINKFAVDEFVPIVDWLQNQGLNVPCMRPSVIHLDYHTHNILIRDDGEPFVIDWTNIGIADYRMDLAWTVLLQSTYGHDDSRRIIIDEYERIIGQKVEQFEYFEVMAALRRLISIVGSLSAGSDKLGMRPEAVESMKKNAIHIKNVYEVICDRTEIEIPKVERLISTLL